MKKLLFFAAVAAGALCSCSSDETISEEMGAIQDKPIAFDMYTAGDSRAAVLDADGLKTAGFGVYTVLNTEYATLFMDNNKVSTEAWTYSPVKYWPKDEVNNKLNFYFYAPYAEDAAGNIGARTITASDKTLAFKVNAAIASQTDLLWAAPVTGSTYTSTDGKEGGKVKASFKHALSRIGFSAQRDAAYEGTTIKINSISIDGDFNTSGVLNLAATAYADAIWSSKVKSTAVSYSPALQNVDNITVDAKQVNTDSEYIMVVPSTADGKTPFTITVDYDVTTDGVTTNNVITSDAMEKAFEIGKAYTFNVKIGLNAIEFTADVTGWDPQTAEDLVIK